MSNFLLYISFIELTIFGFKLFKFSELDFKMSNFDFDNTLAFWLGSTPTTFQFASLQATKKSPVPQPMSKMVFLVFGLNPELVEGWSSLFALHSSLFALRSSYL